jgi:AcrR family transcriptional regulator
MSTLIERRKVEWDLTMKSSISEAAIAVLNEYGFAGLKMARVADAAGVAKGTLYNYFKNKDELLVYVMDMKFEAIFRSFLQVRDSKLIPPKKIEAIIREALTFLEGERSLVLVVIDAEGLSLPVKDKANGKREEVIRIIAAIIEEGIKGGFFKKFDAVQIAKLIFGAIHASFRINFDREDKERTINERVYDCIELFFSGLIIKD